MSFLGGAFPVCSLSVPEQASCLFCVEVLILDFSCEFIPPRCSHLGKSLAMDMELEEQAIQCSPGGALQAGRRAKVVTSPFFQGDDTRVVYGTQLLESYTRDFLFGILLSVSAPPDAPPDRGTKRKRGAEGKGGELRLGELLQTARGLELQMQVLRQILSNADTVTYTWYTSDSWFLCVVLVM